MIVLEIMATAHESDGDCADNRTQRFNQRGGQHHASDGCWRSDRDGDNYDVMRDDGDDAWREHWWKTS